MKKILFYALLFLYLPAAAQTAAEANQFFNNRQFAEAGKVYEALLQQNPNSVLFNYRFARCMFELGNWELARDHFYRSGIRNYLTNFFLGGIYFELGEYQQAVAAYQIYLANISPSHTNFQQVQERITQAEQRIAAGVRRVVVVDTPPVAVDTTIVTVDTPPVVVDTPPVEIPPVVIDTPPVEIPPVVVDTPVVEAAVRTAAEANRLFENRQFAEAASIYEELIAADPQNILLNYRFARTLFEINTGNQTRISAEQLRTYNPLTNFFLGEIYFSANDFQQALLAYELYFATIDSNHLDFLHVQSRIAHAQGIVTPTQQSLEEANRLFDRRQFAEAAVLYEAMLRIDPQNTFLNYRFARCMFETRNWERAREHFHLAGDEFQLTKFFLGESYFALSQYERAIAAFELFLKTIDNNHWRYSHTQSRIVRARRNLNLNVMIEVPIETVPVEVTPPTQQELAAVFFNNQQFAEAAVIYEALLNEDPQNQMLNYQFARTLFAMGNREQSRAHFELSGTHFPRRNFYLGEIHFDAGEYEQAVIAYEAYLRNINAEHYHFVHVQQQIAHIRQIIATQNIQNIVDETLVGKIDETPAETPDEIIDTAPAEVVLTAQTAAEADRLFTNRQFAEAGRLYAALVQSDPENPLYNYRFARTLYEQGYLEPARQYFHRSGSQFALTNFYLGNIYFALGEYTQALAAYETFRRTINTSHWRFPHVQERITISRERIAVENELAAAALAAAAQSQEYAARLFNDGQFAEAAAILEPLLAENPQDELLNYRFARTLFETGNRERAREHFYRSGTNFPRRDFYLAEIYFFGYEFGNAAAAYHRYLSGLRAGDSNIPNIERRIRQSEQASRMLSRVEDIAIIDSIVVEKNDFLRFFRIARESGSLVQERILVDAERFEDRISHILPSGDMKFMSDFLNGQMALFTAHRLLNDWSTPRPLDASISMGANMNYPFLMLDGVTMFFASDGEGSIGGYDIFITRYFPATSTFLPPENMGMPFNSPFNDFMLVIDEINNVGWFASDRFQPPGKVIIYSFVPNPTRVTVTSNNMAEVRSRAKLQTFRHAERFAVTELETLRAAARDAERAVERAAETASAPPAGNISLNRRDLRQLTEATMLMRTQMSSLQQEYIQAQTAEQRADVVRRIRALERNIQDNDAVIQQHSNP